MAVVAFAAALFAVARRSAPNESSASEPVVPTTGAEPLVLVVPTTSAEAGLDVLSAMGIREASREEDDARVAGIALTLAPAKSRKDVASALEGLLKILDEAPPGPMPEGALDLLGASALPLLTSATPLAVRRISASDGTLALAIVGRCPTTLPDGAKCVRAWDDSGNSDSNVRRARQLTWGVSLAVAVAVDGARARDALLDKFRARMEKADGSISLSFTRAHLATPSDEAKVLHRAAASAEAAANKRERTVPRPLRLLATPLRDGPLVPWLGLPDDVIVVSPRLGVLTKLGTFVRECEEVIGDTPVTWVHKPVPLPE